jgi:hypothetical protein
VDFEMFRPDLDAVFKALVIQTTNNLSDERAEFLINDRLSFMRLQAGRETDVVFVCRIAPRISARRTAWPVSSPLRRETVRISV